MKINFLDLLLLCLAPSFLEIIFWRISLLLYFFTNNLAQLEFLCNKLY